LRSAVSISPGSIRKPGSLIWASIRSKYWTLRRPMTHEIAGGIEPPRGIVVQWMHDELLGGENGSLR
jgi:hypothetical protein